MKIIQDRLTGPSSEQSALTKQKRPDRTGTCYNVLFLCADNSICSIMAEALLKRWGGEDFRAFSAGITPRGEIDPLATDLLQTRRVWHQDLRSKSYREFFAEDAPQMDFIISVGERPPTGLPAPWRGSPRVIHWHITEPVFRGSNPDANSLRRTFGELENRIRLFVLVYQKAATLRSATAA